ncbi:MAG: HNH endonuclease signature motif containing protein [Longimicrobiales bacterium]
MPSSGSPPSGSPPPDTLRAAAQRRADALALLAERAMAAGFGGRMGGGRPVGAEPTEGADGAPISGTRAARYQVVLHVDFETLSEHGGSPDAVGGGSGRSELEDGTRVSAETSRRISCDAGLVRITHGPDGSVLDVGRRTRTIPPALRRALEARDRGCRFPGCGSRFTDAHHVKHWADGGETSLTNTTLLCRHHHTLVHEGGWRVIWSRERRPVFVDPRGGTHYDARPKAPELAEHPVRALVEANRRRGAEPDWRTAGARWKREDDIPRDVYFRALEAAG